MAEIVVLIVEPGKAPRLARMENTVEAFEKLVGTPLDFGCFMPEKVMLISNANGAGQGLPPNRANPRGKEYLFGTFLLCGVGEDFASIPATQAEYFKKYFEKPGKLKTHLIHKEVNRLKQGREVVQYIGIAADEARRCRDKRYPLVQDRMNGAPDLGAAGETVSIVQIPLDQLHDFPDHPFEIREDTSMRETVDSVKEYGVLVPAIVRPREEGGYEIVAGHRRKRACELAGLKTMPAIVREMDRDAATIFMVDSNLQRENILPSERAKAYKMKLEAIKRQAGRPAKNAPQLGTFPERR